MNEKELNSLDSHFKLLVKTSFIVFISLLLSKILTYLFRIIIARDLGPEIYGFFNLSFMISNFFIAIFSFGLVSGLLRYLSFYLGKKEIEKVRYLFYSVSYFFIFSSLVGAAILFFSSDFISITFFHNPELSYYLKWFAAVIPFSLLCGIFYSVLRTYEMIGTYSFIYYIVQSSVQLFLIIILLKLGFGRDAMLLAYSVGILSILFFTFLFTRIKIKEIFKKPDISKQLKKNLWKEIFSYSWPLFFSGTALLIFTWADSFTIGYFMDVVNVGFYSAAIPIAALLSIAPMLFMQLFFPMITKEFSNSNMEIIKELSKQITKWILILNLPLFTLLFLFPGAFINILFGSEYLPAVNALRYLSVGFLFYSFSELGENLLSMAGKSKIVLINLLIAMLLNIALNILLVPKYGLEGAAFSTMISYFLWTSLSFYQARKIIKTLPLKRKMLNIVIALIISASILILVKNYFTLNLFSLILLSSLFFLVYIFFIFITGCLDKNDIMILKSVINKLF